MRIVKTFVCFVLLFISVQTFTGCAFFKDSIVPVAEGQDAVIVNAERAQRSSLDIYEMTVTWEYNNRAVLPAEVSRAVDAFRKEFPPVWRQSRDALKEYKVRRGPSATDMERITAALLITQERLLALQREADPNQATQAMSSLRQLLESIRVLTGRSVTPTPTTK